MPGEITMAHNGVLFLDEVGEFKRENIEALRIPLEEGEITHFRHGRAYRFPSDFRLVMATNPCPAGIWEIRSESAGARRERLRITESGSAAPCWSVWIC